MVFSVNDYILSELSSLGVLTSKSVADLVRYYHSCSSLVLSTDFSTQYEAEAWVGELESVVLDFVRDYALFDDDSSFLLRGFDPLGGCFDCFSSYRF